jgi:hypothetical protein
MKMAAATAYALASDSIARQPAGERLPLTPAGARVRIYPDLTGDVYAPFAVYFREYLRFVGVGVYEVGTLFGVLGLLSPHLCHTQYQYWSVHPSIIRR